MSKTDLLEDTDKSKLREDCEPAVTSVVSDSVNLWTAAYQIPLSMAFSGKNTGWGCQALLQGIFLAQGSNPRVMSPALIVRFFTTSIT